MNKLDFFDIISLQEDIDVEFKAATGRDGQGKLPKSFWESFSAMANSYGGYIFLGVKEKNKQPVVEGIKNPDTVLKELWDNLNNPQKISSNILTEQHVKIIKKTDSEKVVIRIEVPQVDRKTRPVYINGNPLTGTYRRNFEGDYRCSEITVKQMLADQSDITRDAKLLEHFDMDDINLETLISYRQYFSTRQPTHPFNDYEHVEFLRNIGAWVKNRNSKNQGLTLAGLLMFGKLRSILDAVPNYVVDYQEHPRTITESRWTDRITTDFTWSGNLYDFYKRVINKLCEDLKVPFILKGDARIDDTPVHEALREALVNTIIHADYSGTVPLLVIKRPDMFSFRNPGILRIPKALALKGGTSDCRNRNLQKIFQLIGRGEQAGSGFPKIIKGWNSQHWKHPELEEQLELNQTILVLSTMSLLPENEVDDLKKRLGAVFNTLNKQEITSLVVAKTENCITHMRLKELTTEHSADLTKTLHGLVRKGLLLSDGIGKGTFYYLQGHHPIHDTLGVSVLDDDSSNVITASTNQVTSVSQHDASNSPHNEENSPHNEENSPHNEENSPHNKVNDILKPIAEKKRVKPEVLRKVIVGLCQQQPFYLKEIANLVNRNEEMIRRYYIGPMCKEGLLKRLYPNIINHPDQKYLAN